MDSDKIIELENYLFDVLKAEKRAAGIMADLVGVRSGIKPVMAGYFSEGERKSADLDRLSDIIGSLKLRIVFYDYYRPYDGKMVKYFYVSKSLVKARKTHEAFLDLWSSMDGLGQIVSAKKWRKATKKIGKMLGYPKTAVESFIKGWNEDDEEREKRMERNRYYAHSAKYEEKEYQQYDRKLNYTISKYAPKTTKCLTKNKKKRWL